MKKYIVFYYCSGVCMRMCLCVHSPVCMRQRRQCCIHLLLTSHCSQLFQGSCVAASFYSGTAEPGLQSTHNTPKLTKLTHSNMHRHIQTHTHCFSLSQSLIVSHTNTHTQTHILLMKLAHCTLPPLHLLIFNIQTNYNYIIQLHNNEEQYDLTHLIYTLQAVETLVTFSSRLYQCYRDDGGPMCEPLVRSYGSCLRVGRSDIYVCLSQRTCCLHYLIIHQRPLMDAHRRSYSC